MTSQWYEITFGPNKPLDPRPCRLLVVDGRVAAQIAFPVFEVIGDSWAELEAKINDLGWAATKI